MIIRHIFPDSLKGYLYSQVAGSLSAHVACSLRQLPDDSRLIIMGNKIKIFQTILTAIIFGVVLLIGTSTVRRYDNLMCHNFCRKWELVDLSHVIWKR